MPGTVTWSTRVVAANADDAVSAALLDYFDRAATHLVNRT